MHKFQSQKGTRDFYPADMAVLRHIESIWREVSIAHGFDEIDGPTFEHLELYTAKSGPGIFNKLFSFRRADGDVDYALRPEFTPTLARMCGSKAAQLPKPVKWFCMPSFFRGERPQRGRLREFFQWNADILGDDSPRADAEIIALTIGILQRFGLGPNEVRVKINDRIAAGEVLARFGVGPEKHEEAFALMDRKDKIDPEAFVEAAASLGLTGDRLRRYLDQLDATAHIGDEVKFLRIYEAAGQPTKDRILDLSKLLKESGLENWCGWNPSIFRGLVCYTGTVFEVITEGEKAIAGGGRYDKLVELFGGPSTPAVGIAMGDVVLRLMLEDRGLLKPEDYLPRPDAFLINALDDDGGQMVALAADLRRDGLHVRHRYRTTKNIGKLLGEAGKAHARFAVILGMELADGLVVVKDLDEGKQEDVRFDALAVILKEKLSG